MGACRGVAACLILCFLVVSCANQAERLHGSERRSAEAELIVLAPKNLSGRPLSAIDSTFYASDSLEISKQLAGVNLQVDFIQLFEVALRTAVEKEGDGLSLKGLRLHAALETWDSSSLADAGMLVVSLAGALSRSHDGAPVAQDYRSHSFRLLDVGADGEVVGASRIIKGRYETLAYALASSLVRRLFAQL